MKRPMVRIYTGSENFIDREMNDAEFEQYKLDKAAAETEQIELLNILQTKISAYQKLGLNEAEIKSLLPIPEGLTLGKPSA
jgi:hypothetical protein